MMTKHKVKFAKNARLKTIKVTKTVDAGINQVYKASTNSDHLDKWCGPKTWNAVTRRMDFNKVNPGSTIWKARMGIDNGQD